MREEDAAHRTVDSLQNNWDAQTRRGEAFVNANEMRILERNSDAHRLEDGISAIFSFEAKRSHDDLQERG